MATRHDFKNREMNKIEKKENDWGGRKKIIIKLHNTYYKKDNETKQRKKCNESIN